MQFLFIASVMAVAGGGAVSFVAALDATKLRHRASWFLVPASETRRLRSIVPIWWASGLATVAGLVFAIIHLIAKIPNSVVAGAYAIAALALVLIGGFWANKMLQAIKAFRHGNPW